MPAEGSSDGIVFDFERRARIGLAEAVLASGKSTAQLTRLLALAREHGAPLLLTRLAPANYEALAADDRARLDYDPLSLTAIQGPWQAPSTPPRVALVTAGTSDLPVAGEAARTLAFHGETVSEFFDIGVAGLWRLLERQEAIRRFGVIIAVAGMDGALFSVLGGLAPGLVVAVPTATGYGAARGGETALNAALASCAPGLVAVNIDNGYGAAAAALRALQVGSIAR